MKSKSKNIICGLIASISLLAIDQVTKLLAIMCLKDKNPFVIIENVFELRYLENTGAAFGILQNKMEFLIPFSLLLSIVFVVLFLKIPFTKRFLPLRILLCFFLSGALGNFIDRIVYGYVVDFFYFKLIDFPIFNVADIYITCSCFVFAILVFAFYKDEDLEAMRIWKRKEK